MRSEKIKEILKTLKLKLCDINEKSKKFLEELKLVLCNIYEKSKKFLKTSKSVLCDIKNGTSHSVDYLLSNEVDETLSEKGIDKRKDISPLLLKTYSTKTDYKIIVDSREELPKTEKGKIFIVNHRQADDIVIAANIINENGYILFGNPDLALETLDGLGLWLNGVILVLRDSDLSRQASVEKMEYVLEHGGNVIIWAEGYWNLADDGKADEKHGADDHNSESWFIQDLHLGPFRSAKKISSLLVPVILHYDETDGKKCYGSSGKAFSINKNDDVFDKKDEFKEIMQTTYYGLMEKYSTYIREELEYKILEYIFKSNNIYKTLKMLEKVSKENNLTIRELLSRRNILKLQWEKLKKELVAACDIKRINYHLDLANEKLIGKAKVVNPVVTNEEAFEHLSLVKKYRTEKNEFLLEEGLTGLRK